MSLCSRERGAGNTIMRGQIRRKCSRCTPYVKYPTRGIVYGGEGWGSVILRKIWRLSSDWKRGSDDIPILRNVDVIYVLPRQPLSYFSALFSSPLTRSLPPRYLARWPAPFGVGKKLVCNNQNGKLRVSSAGRPAGTGTVSRSLV